MPECRPTRMITGSSRAHRPPKKIRTASLGVGALKSSTLGTTPSLRVRRNHTTQAMMVRYTAGAMPAMNIDLMETPADTP